MHDPTMALLCSLALTLEDSLGDDEGSIWHVVFRLRWRVARRVTWLVW
jgi:hypothetical protein